MGTQTLRRKRQNCVARAVCEVPSALRRYVFFARVTQALVSVTISNSSTSDLQQARHLQKKSGHGAAQSGHKARIEVAPPGPKKARSAFFLRLVRLQFSLCAPIVPLCDATFLQMMRLLQVTSTCEPKSITHRFSTRNLFNSLSPGWF